MSNDLLSTSLSKSFCYCWWEAQTWWKFFDNTQWLCCGLSSDFWKPLSLSELPMEDKILQALVLGFDTSIIWVLYIICFIISMALNHKLKQKMIMHHLNLKQFAHLGTKNTFFLLLLTLFFSPEIFPAIVALNNCWIIQESGLFRHQYRA